MTQRITDKQLDSLCSLINAITNSPQEPWANGQANVGNYHVSHAYGGVCLHRHVNEGGGVNCPIVHGHVPKRELFNLMHAYIKGLQEVTA
jgi:hypothetical protein